jgi:hypothetical protein
MPTFGIVYDPEMRMLYWANITAHLRQSPDAHSIPVGESDTLTASNVTTFVEIVTSYISGTKLQLRPERGQSLRAAVAGRFAQTKPEQAVGGNPNALFASIDNWMERNERLVLWGARGICSTVIAITAAATSSRVYDFATRYAAPDWDGGLWTWSVMTFAAFAAGAGYYERRAGRNGSPLLLVAFIPILGYCLLGKVAMPQPTGELIAGLGMSLAHVGLIAICGFYVIRETSRKRRLRAIHGASPFSESGGRR